LYNTTLWIHLRFFFIKKTYFFPPNRLSYKPLNTLFLFFNSDNALIGERLMKKYENFLRRPIKIYQHYHFKNQDITPSDFHVFLSHLFSIIHQKNEFVSFIETKLTKTSINHYSKSPYLSRKRTIL